MYWIAVHENGEEINGIKRNTRDEAERDCVNAYSFDWTLNECDPGRLYLVEQREEG